MLAHRSDVWVLPPSKRARLQCSGVLALLMLATLVTQVAVPRAGQPIPGACHREPARPLPVGLLH